MAVANGAASASWISVMSESLPLLQRGTRRLMGPQTWDFSTPCSEFIFAGAAAATAGPGGPYVVPLRVPVFKLRNEPQCYRMWSDQSRGGSLVVNARVDFLRAAEYAAAERSEAARGARHGGIGDTACFQRFHFVQGAEGEPPLCVDLERLRLVRPAAGRTWDAAARTYDMEDATDPLPWSAAGGQAAIRRRPAAHVPSGTPWGATWGCSGPTGASARRAWSWCCGRRYGDVTLVCSRPDDPSVRTSVHVQSPCVGRGGEGLLVAAAAGPPSGGWTTAGRSPTAGTTPAGGGRAATACGWWARTARATRCGSSTSRPEIASSCK